jgi:hypothetical protein
MINENKKGVKAVKHTTKAKGVEPPKPRNFVAKNAINTGAGAHKDKKKAVKQGDVKHKNKEYAESLQDKLTAAISESNRGYEHGFASPTAPSLSRRRDRDSGDDEPKGIFTVIINGKPWKEATSNEAFAMAQRVANKHPDKKIAVKWPTGQLNAVKAQGVAEGKNNIDDKIIYLMTNGIPAEEIARKLDIPVEWVHEVAKYNMPDSAIDYNDPRNSTQGRERFGEQGVAEGGNPKQAAIAIAKKESGKYTKDGKRKTNEGWTHDSLAAELFEIPSYENRLQEMLDGQVAFMEGGTNDGVTMFSKSPGSHQHQNNSSKPDQEQDLEGNTVKNSLHTIVRVATHLEKAVTDDEEFPEWVSEKIGSIKSMMVSVMDYVISSHEQANGDRLDHGPK